MAPVGPSLQLAPHQRGLLLAPKRRLAWLRCHRLNGLERKEPLPSFRLSAAAVSMSLTGSCFSPELCTRDAFVSTLQNATAVAALAKKLPEGRLYGNGRGFVPNIRQSLYSEIIVTLVGEPHVAAIGKDQDELPVATGLPRTLLGNGISRAETKRPKRPWRFKDWRRPHT
jgi:hypothetical protein